MNNKLAPHTQTHIGILPIKNTTTTNHVSFSICRLLYANSHTEEILLKQTFFP